MDDTERERWRGGVDKDVERNAENIKQLYVVVNKQGDDFQDLRIVVNTISTKLVLYAGLGAFVGGGVMSVIVGWVLRH